MSVSPEAMAAALGRSVTTLCNAWRLTFADGAQLGFTDHDRPLEIDGLAFEPQSGMSASEVRQSLGLAVDSVDVSGALSSEAIRETDILSGRFDGAVVETLLVDWTNSEAHTVVRTATVGRISRGDGAFTAELDAFARGFDQPSAAIRSDEVGCAAQSPDQGDDPDPGRDGIRSFSRCGDRRTLPRRDDKPDPACAACAKRFRRIGR